MGALLGKPLESMLALPEINGIYDRVTHASASPETFAQKCLDDMGVTIQVSQADMDRIPRTGPLVVVANHPFGGVEGLILTSVLLKVRPEFKVMVNYLMSLIPQLQPVCVFVDPFGVDVQQNVRGLKNCLKLLRAGGSLGVFPSGEVSHLQLRTRTIEDPQWSHHVAGLIRRTGASVLPLYFDGNNGAMFQIAGLIHPRLRTALLPRATLNRRHTTCHVHVGRVISGREIGGFTTDESLSDYLRNRTYALAERKGVRPNLVKRTFAFARLRFKRQPIAVPVATPVEPARVARELAALGSSAMLSSSGDLQCYIATARQVPSVMQEIGRLREETFRSVGEGTGQAVDIDAFDKTYHHLIVWNAPRQQIVGSYRLGLTDALTARVGNAGLYCHTLFDFPADFFFKLGPAIELGRSFIRREYQRSFSPLLLLWKGIGTFIAQNPQYRNLYGPCSISNAYTPLSRALVAEFMMRPERRHRLASTLRPRIPAKFDKPLLHRARLLAEPLKELDDLSDLVSDIEPDSKTLPVLLKQYAKLGARALAFNVDPAFGHCLDGLCMLDMLDADTRALERYMGKEQVAQFFSAHGKSLPPRK